MIGTTLSDRYQIVSEIGRGGLGIVYKGHDLLLDRPVAIKVINTSILGADGNARLFQEARIIAQLNHPNIVTIYDAGEIGEITFVVMELVEGYSLYDRPPKDLDELVSIMRLVCSGLEHAHQHGVIHRDLKPENVMISPDGRLRLMDFGLARSISTRLTTEGIIVGTVFYLSPEQALGQEVNGRSDLYSLGVMLYELATGRLPYSGDDPLTVITQHLYSTPLPPRDINSEIPLPLASLILSLMSRNPEERPSSAGEVFHMLESIQQQPAPVLAQAPEELDLARIGRGRIAGRQRELAELVNAWRRVLKEQTDERVVLVSGEPGVGKTRLVQEFMTRAALEKAVVMLAECYEEEGAPYAPLAQPIRQVLLRSKDPDQVFPDSRVLADLIRLAPDLQSYFPEVAANPRLDPKDEQQRLYDSMMEMLVWLCQKSPLLLVIDDAHWADRATLSLIRYLARHSKSLKLPLVIVATYREIELDEARPWHEVMGDLNRERLSVRLKLSRLNKQNTQDMLEMLFNEGISSDFVDGIYFETEGNPFFIEEVVKALVDEGKVYFKDGTWHHPSMDEIVIPQSVRIAIQTRLTALPSGTQEMLRMASVLGREFDDLLIQKAAQMDEDMLIDALENAERAQLIREIEPKQRGEVRYSFVHALMQATIYDSVSGLRRQRFHRQAAAAIEAVRPQDYEALSVHYQEGGDLDRARANALKAGERALELFTNKDAECYFRAALELEGTDEEKAQAFSGLGRGFFRQSLFTDAINTWKQAIPLYQKLGAVDKVARTYACLSEAARNMGDIEGGISYGEEGLSILTDQPFTKGKIALMRETGNALTIRGKKDKAVTLYRQALEEAERIGDIEEQAETLNRLGFEIYFSNRPDRLDSIQMLIQALEMAESAGLYNTAEMVHTYLAEFLDSEGDISAAKDHFEAAIQLARKMGLAGRELFNLNWMCYFHFMQGNHNEFENVMVRYRYLTDICGTSGPAGLGFRIVSAIDAYGRREIEQAIEMMNEAYLLAKKTHNINWLSNITQFLAECLISEGKWPEAEASLTNTIPVLEQENVFDLYILLSFIYSQMKRLDEAHAMQEKARDSAGSIISHADRFYLEIANAIMASREGRWQDTWQHFDQASILVSQRGFRWYEAFILRTRAQVLLDRDEPGDRDKACDLLKSSMEVYQQMQLPAWVDFIENLLQALCSV